MEKRYFNDAAKNYLVLRQEDVKKTSGYQYRMISENRIDGLLACSIREIDGERYLYYDITSMQSLDRYCDNRNLDSQILDEILRRLISTGKILMKYLLDSSKLVLSPDLVYRSYETGEFYFVYYPECEEGQSLMALLTFARSKVTQEDKRTIYMIYWLMDKAENPNFILKEELLDMAYNAGGVKTQDPGWQKPQDRREINHKEDAGWSGSRAGTQSDPVYADYYSQEGRKTGERSGAGGEQAFAYAGAQPEMQKKKADTFEEKGRWGEESKRAFRGESKRTGGLKKGRAAEKVPVPDDRASYEETGEEKEVLEAEKERMAKTLILSLVFLLAAIADELVNLYVPLEGTAVLIVRVALIVFLAASIVTAAVGTILSFMKEKRKRAGRNREKTMPEIPKVRPASAYASFDGPGMQMQEGYGKHAFEYSTFQNSFQERKNYGRRDSAAYEDKWDSDPYGNTYSRERQSYEQAEEDRYRKGADQYPKEDYGFMPHSKSKKEAAPSLYGIGSAGQYRIHLDALPCIVGNSSQYAKAVIPDAGVGRMQARFFAGNNHSILMEDLNSRSGTFLNGVRLMPNECMELARGDEIRFGSLSFIFR